MRYLIGIVAIFMIGAGAFDSYESVKNPEPVAMSVSNYMKSDKSLPYVTLTDAKINLFEAVVIKKEKSDKITGLYVPINAEDFEQKDKISLLLESDDKALLETANTMYSLSSAEQLKYFAQNRDKLMFTQAISGKMSDKQGMKSEHQEKITTHIKNLAGEFYLMDHNYLPDIKRGAIIFVIGLVVLLLVIVRIVKKARS